jgi:hypothetical protein
MSLASPEIIEAYRHRDLYLLIILPTTPTNMATKPEPEKQDQQKGDRNTQRDHQVLCGEAASAHRGQLSFRRSQPCSGSRISG